MSQNLHSHMILALDNDIREARLRGAVVINGSSLTIADIIAISCYNVKPTMTEDTNVLGAIPNSICVLKNHLTAGRPVYGVNTGFGGSADVRTKHTERLQSAMVQHVNVGILLSNDKGLQDHREGKNPKAAKHYPLQGWNSMAIPTPVVRAMMVVRANSLLRGHSAVRVEVIKGILSLVKRNATPIVPLRGSISASGDLCPLSYIGGVLEGNPDMYVQFRDGDVNRIASAREVLAVLGLQPVRFQAKEALGITNGTATSTAAASLALYQAHALGLMSQLLTSVATEALDGRASNYDPFISHCRPHRGQTEAAANMAAFLAGSSLVRDSTAGRHRRSSSSANDGGQIPLAQDRYALRTAPQWIGPQLETLMLAQEQVGVELNSTTDNPLVDSVHDSIHHGGNFQAVSITSAMEKVTSVLQYFGRIIFAQSSELYNVKLSPHLPPNLSPDDPSTSFVSKGFDVNMAAYMAELARISTPISPYVQSAEMHNQSVNSMALVSARLALDAVELVSLMMATHMYGLAQALDLRCLQIEFEKALWPQFEMQIGMLLSDSFHSKEAATKWQHAVWAGLIRDWVAQSNLDLDYRAKVVARNTSSLCLLELQLMCTSYDVKSPCNALALMEKIQIILAPVLLETYEATRREFFAKPTTNQYLGRGSEIMYSFVRETLQVPIHRGLEDHPTLMGDDPCSADTKKRTLGTMASIIYSSFQDGSLFESMMSSIRKVDGIGGNETSPRAPINGVNGTNGHRTRY